jgi:hypothetical protein
LTQNSALALAADLEAFYAVDLPFSFGNLTSSRDASFPVAEIPLLPLSFLFFLPSF